MFSESERKQTIQEITMQIRNGHAKSHTDRLKPGNLELWSSNTNTTKKNVQDWSWYD